MELYRVRLCSLTFRNQRAPLRARSTAIQSNSTMRTSWVAFEVWLLALPSKWR